MLCLYPISIPMVTMYRNAVHLSSAGVLDWIRSIAFSSNNSKAMNSSIWSELDHVCPSSQGWRALYLPCPPRFQIPRPQDLWSRCSVSLIIFPPAYANDMFYDIISSNQRFWKLLRFPSCIISEDRSRFCSDEIKRRFFLVKEFPVVLKRGSANCLFRHHDGLIDWKNNRQTILIL